MCVFLCVCLLGMRGGEGVEERGGQREWEAGRGEQRRSDRPNNICPCTTLGVAFQAISRKLSRDVLASHCTCRDLERSRADVRMLVGRLLKQRKEVGS